MQIFMKKDDLDLWSSIMWCSPGNNVFSFLCFEITFFLRPCLSKILAHNTDNVETMSQCEMFICVINSRLLVKFSESHKASHGASTA